MTKFYRVIVDTPLWEENCIISSTGSGYRSISDLFDSPAMEKQKANGSSGEYLSDEIVEFSPKFFERVYEVNLLQKTVYQVKEAAKAHFSKEFKAK